MRKKQHLQKIQLLYRCSFQPVEILSVKHSRPDKRDQIAGIPVTDTLNNEMIDWMRAAATVLSRVKK